MANFLTDLKVSPLEDGLHWKVDDPFDYHVGSLSSTLIIDVPVGFVTDFASIPRFLWWLWPPWGTYGKAALIHDRLYQDGMFSRATSDSILLEAMGVSGVGVVTRWLIYLGVRLGGGSAWAQHRMGD